MDNNFSAQVKEIISYSREEALRLGNDFIGTEHLVLGLIRDEENTAIKILKSLNIDLQERRKEIEVAVKDKTGKNIANINSLPLTKQAEKVIRITVPVLLLLACIAVITSQEQETRYNSYSGAGGGSSGSYTPTCGGNCPSGDCTSSCPCGSTPNTSISPAEACASFNGWSQSCCQCIVNHESGGNQNAMNQNTDGTFDVGLWQINARNWASCNGGQPPCAFQANLQCAIKVWQWGGSTFRLWSTNSICGC